MCQIYSRIHRLCYRSANTGHDRLVAGLLFRGQEHGRSVLLASAAGLLLQEQFYLMMDSMRVIISFAGDIVSIFQSSNLQHDLPTVTFLFIW